MAKRTQTTATLPTDKAHKFRMWLQRNVNDADYGHPVFVNMREVGGDVFVVEYTADGDCEFVRGVIHGIRLG